MTFKGLNRQAYQKFLNEYAQTHAKDTVRKMNNFIWNAMQEAILEGIVYIDPTQKVVIKAGNPNKSKDEKFLNIIPLEEIPDALARLSKRHINGKIVEKVK